MEHRKRWSGQQLMNCCDWVVYEGSASSSPHHQWIRREHHASNLQGEDCHRGKTFVKPLWKRHKTAVQWYAGSSSGIVTVWYVWFLPGCTARSVAVLARSWVPTLFLPTASDRQACPPWLQSIVPNTSSYKQQTWGSHRKMAQVWTVNPQAMNH